MSERKLLRYVAAGRLKAVLRLLDTLPDAERRACLPALRELRQRLRPEPFSRRAVRAHPALHAAGAACHTSVTAAAAWIAGADLRWNRAPTPVLLDLLGRRPPEWQAELARRLADRPASAELDHALLAGLVRQAGCAPPTTRTYLAGWVDQLTAAHQSGTLLDRLRADPHTPLLVCALFDTQNVGTRLTRPSATGFDSWPTALACLAEEGVLDRAVLLDRCVARLLRGGRVTDQRLFLRVLKALTPTRAEELARLADWAALAADGPDSVASYAQSVLAGLALDGELTTGQLARISETVLFRPERTLARAQLVLLGKVLRRDASSAPELLPTVTAAFGHSDSEVQKRALTLVSRHLEAAGPVARAAVVPALGQLSPGLRQEAAAALGVDLEPAPAAGQPDTLPPPPEPQRLPPPPGSAAELAEDVAALLASPQTDPAAFECALDGLVRWAHTDREAVTEALGPAVARQWWMRFGPLPYDQHQRFSTFRDGISVVLAALLDRIHTETLVAGVQRRTGRHSCVHAALANAWDARLWEVAHRLRTDPVPFLLATPTWESGRLDADVLVARLAEYHRLGIRPGPCDTALALLRVDRRGAGGARHAAAALGTPEGDRLAAWLAREDPAPAPSERRAHPHLVLVEPPPLGEDLTLFPPTFRPLGEPVPASADLNGCIHWDADEARHWLCLVPGHRELVAARLLRNVVNTAVHDDRDTPAYLSWLAEADGPAGEAVHLSVGYGLCARHGENRMAAVDALLILAAQQQVDTRLLGTLLGTLLSQGIVVPSRLAASARTAGETGAWALVWSVLGTALPSLLTARAANGFRSVAGLGDLLEVAAESAERCAARAEMPQLAEVTARGGRSKLVAQARRLQRALTTCGAT